MTWIKTFILLAVCVGGVGRGAVAGEPLEYLFATRPAVPDFEIAHIFSPELRRLWLEALAHDELGVQRQAAEEIARATQQGMTDLEETIPPLQQALKQTEAPLAVQAAFVQALIALDARDAASQLFERLQAEPTLAQLIEPALANWDYAPMRAIWLQRVQASQQRLGPRQQVMAIEALGVVKESQAQEPLQKLVLETRSSAEIRLAAATALGRIAPVGLEALAAQLAPDTTAGVVDCLCAEHLLHFHESPQAQQQLAALLQHAEPVVVTTAGERLLESAPEKLTPEVSRLMAASDGGLRLLAVKTLRTQPSAAGIDQLGTLLADRHPDVRNTARESLLTLDADSQWHSAVRTRALAALQAEKWEGLEQAAVLIGQLDEESAAGRILELLNHTQPEVMLASAWSLRTLDVAETYPQMLAFAKKSGPKLLEMDEGEEQDVAIFQLGYVLEVFGLGKYQAATEFLTAVYLNEDYKEARMSAAYSLSHIYAGTQDPHVTGIFLSVLTGDRVHHMARVAAAIGLGRLKSEVALPFLRDRLERTGNATYTELAYLWALEQISGNQDHQITLAPMKHHYLHSFVLPLHE